MAKFVPYRSPTRRLQAVFIGGHTIYWEIPIRSQNSKLLGNQQAIEVSKEVRNDLSTFRDYVLASIIGNTFDYGVKGHIVERDFSVFFQKEYAKGLTIDDTDKIFPLCSRVVYLSDNCGEIVLDRLLMEYLKTRVLMLCLQSKIPLFSMTQP